MLNLFGIGPRVIDIYGTAELLELFDYVDDAGVTDIGAVFLECDPKDEDF